MRSAEAVQQYNAELLEKYGEDDSRVGYYTACYESCIPKEFWKASSEQVTHNRSAFQVILKYCSRRKKVQRSGYSLLLMGDNGAGKTLFISFVLTQMIRRGLSAYYTTLAQLDIDIKKGFKDSVAENRLELLLTSDFLAIDEVGKEHYRSDSYLNTRLEALIKERYDNGEPVLMGTNKDYESLVEMYGPSLASMWDGKYTKLALESGDFRRSAQAKMRKELGL